MVEIDNCTSVRPPHRESNKSLSDSHSIACRVTQHELKPTQEFPSSLFFNTIRRKNYLKHFPSNNLLSLREEKRNLIRLLAGKNTPTSSGGLNYTSNWLIDFPQYLKNWTACLKCCQIYSLYVSFVLWRSGLTFHSETSSTVSPFHVIKETNHLYN